MRGDDEQTGHLFSYLSPEQRVPPDHPLRTICTMTDEALRRLSPRLETLYATPGRPSIPPEHLLRALLLQVLYSVRSERMLMEQLEYDLLFRWFVGLGMDARCGRPRPSRERDGCSRATSHAPSLRAAEHSPEGRCGGRGRKSFRGGPAREPPERFPGNRRSIAMGNGARTRRSVDDGSRQPLSRRRRPQASWCIGRSAACWKTGTVGGRACVVATCTGEREAASA